MASGVLHVVATPIGNKSDITLRALEVFKSADKILCEDTRQTRKLFEDIDSGAPLASFHQHSSDAKIEALLQELLDGKNIALVTDAGTPAVADPGGRLIEAALQKGITVSPIPGPSSIMAALSVSGFPADRFTFFGFVPKKGRENFLKGVADDAKTSVLFESPYRIHKTLKELVDYMPTRNVVVARELTKKFEEVKRGLPQELLEHFSSNTAKGEFVIVIGPRK